MGGRTSLCVGNVLNALLLPTSAWEKTQHGGGTRQGKNDVRCLTVDEYTLDILYLKRWLKRKCYLLVKIKHTR